MNVDEPGLQLCRQAIEAKLCWGDSQRWTNVDFELLSDRVLTETGVSLSVSTLKRLWGRVPYSSRPQAATLNALARFAGYSSFRDAEAAHRSSASPALGETATDPIVVKQPVAPQMAQYRPLPWRDTWGVGLFMGLFLSLLIAFSLRPTTKNGPVLPPRFTFSSHPVAEGIPNSVVFTFDVSQAHTDCLSVQQSWDSRRRFPIKRTQHQATSIYYYPGFFRAKLLVDKHVVKEHDLLIPTSGWLALISQQPVPVYLPSRTIVLDSVMRVPLSVIQVNHVAVQPQPPNVQYYNVGNFGPVNTDNFDFSTQVRNEYSAGSAVCQHTQVALITEGSVIIIPLSSKGCVSELTLLSLDRQVSGKKADLSAFGVDFNEWVTVRCRGTARHIEFYVNNRLAYRLSAPVKATRLVGLGYGFQGTGAVRKILLRTGDKIIYQSFQAASDIQRLE